LKRGDEVVITNQDCPRLSSSWRQREKRKGIVLKIVPLPAPPVPLNQFYRLVEQQVTPWTEDPNNIRSLRIITRLASL
jgi:selenocysteine lyase/cysteine desulfurase